jgi:TRAP-type C4-dicarboxylate transport system permease small subunit
MSETATTAPAAGDLPRHQPRPRGALGRVDRVLDVVSTTIATVCMWLVAVLLFVMLAAITFQVAARYWIHSVVGAPEEIARLCMVTMVFLALPTLARYSDHVRLDTVQELVKNRVVVEWVHRLALLIEFVFLLVLSVLAYEFVAFLAQSSQESPSLGLRIFWSRLPILVGAALGALVTACVLIRRFINPPGADLDQGAPESDIAPAI